MDIRTLILLACLGVFAAAQQSGDGETFVPISDDEEDIYLEGTPSGDGAEVEGSGGLDEMTTLTIPPHTDCDQATKTCWCLYTDRTEVPNTRRTGLPKCKSMDRPTTALPIRPVETEASTLPLELTEMTILETEGDRDIIIDATIKPIVRLDVQETTTKRYNNKVTNPPEVSNIDEEMEEETNEIGGAWRQVDGDIKREKISAGPFSFAHPGIMAAVIGGAIVGLLCAILLVLFIIYRMRKKDEGSYPLDDSKPLKNYAYAKAPSREFYA